MPTIGVNRDLLFKLLGNTYSMYFVTKLFSFLNYGQCFVNREIYTGIPVENLLKFKISALDRL